MSNESVTSDHYARAKAAFLRGLTSYQEGRFTDAEKSFLASLEQVPGRISTLINLAATRLKLARPADALASADEVLRAEPRNTDALLHRATALSDLERHGAALAAWDAATEDAPQALELWMRRAITLRNLHRLEDAIASYDRALAITPTHADAWNHRGGILKELGRQGEAAESFRNARAHGADPEVIGYFLASLGEDTSPPAAPARYVETLFDDYARDFDLHLVQGLNYRAPERLAHHLRTLAPARYRSALDLGCGTGLCGPWIRPLADALAGVDLSRKMMDQAARRGVYDQLIQADITEHLRTTSQRHDLVVSADVFIYIGDLAPVFSAVRATLHAGGVFGFSVELASPGGPPFELRPSLRYAHTQAYLRQLAAENHFDCVLEVTEPLREDQRVPIGGLYVFLRARAHSAST